MGKYKNVFGIEGKKRILEIGCGPRALAESLSRWYSDAQISARRGINLSIAGDVASYSEVDE